MSENVVKCRNLENVVKCRKMLLNVGIFENVVNCRKMSLNVGVFENVVNLLKMSLNCLLIKGIPVQYKLINFYMSYSIEVCPTGLSLPLSS